VNVNCRRGGSVALRTHARMKDAAGLTNAAVPCKPFNRKCKLEVTVGINRPLWKGIRSGTALQPGIRFGSPRNSAGS